MRRRRFFLLPGLLAVALSLSIGARARAAVLAVPGEYPTIQAAIDAAAEGDSVLVGPGTWRDAETRTVHLCSGDGPRRSVAFLKAGVAVIATDGPDVTTIEPDPSPGDLTYSVLFAGENGGPTLFRGFTVTGPGVAFVVHCSTSPLDVVDCRIRDNDGTGMRIASSSVAVTDTEVARNQGTKASFGGIVMDGGSLELLRTIVDDNLVNGLRVYSADAVHVEECEFREQNDAVNVANCPDLLVRNSFFHDNDSAVQARFCTSAIEDNVFARHSTGTLLLEGGSAAMITGNTIHGTTADIDGSALQSIDTPIEFHDNVVAMCAGKALHGDSVEQSGCNILWLNEDDYGVWNPIDGGPDFVIDPRFCDPEELDFQVQAGSPCLPENGPPGCPDRIGALDAGCPDDGITVIGLATEPTGLQVTADGQAMTAPAIVAWPEGSSHLIGTTGFQEAGGGVAYLFDSWSDGGDLAHTIIVPSSYVEYTATFRTQYLLAAVANGGGTIEGGGWRFEGQVDSLTATALPAHQFLRWEGQGNGSYTGTDNPAVVTMNGPITQTAIFLPDQYMLTMVAGEGGAVNPESGLRDRDSTVEITATADTGWVFDHWEGTGSGAYYGPANPATVTMSGPITQTAIFESITQTLTMVAGPGGTVTPATGPQLLDGVVEITAVPDVGYEFGYWFGEGNGSYEGPLNPSTVTMYGPITQTASFLVGTLPLTMVAGYGGTVTPPTGEFTSFTDVPIHAIADSGHVFREWIGVGDGSYSGTDPLATVTMSGPITQVAEFDRIGVPPESWVGYELGLSLSETDPEVHTGPPAGMGNVYLWLECATDGGLTSLALDLVGTMQPIVFQPSPGIFAAGDAHHVELAADCVVGPVVLGQFLVLAPGEGWLCIDQSAANPPLEVKGCAPAYRTYDWPRRVRFTGVRTDGGVPCESGRGCDEPRGGGIPAAFTTVPVVDGFDSVAPNPFRDAAIVSFSLGEQRRVRVTVYDVAGRRVRTVLDGERPAGPHSVQWPGRDDTSRPVPAGVYFLRLDAGTFRETRKIVRLRNR